MTQMRLLRIRSILIAGTVIFFGINLILFSYVPQLQIKNVEVQGETFVDADAVRKTAELELEKKYFYSIARSQFLFYSENTLGKDLIKKFPEIRDVRVEINNFRDLVISLTEYEPRALWCGEGEVREKCFFVSTDGVVFKEAPQFSEGVYFELYGPIKSSRVHKDVSYKEPLGMRLFSASLFDQIIELHEVFIAMGAPVRSMFYKENNDAYFLLENGPQIHFLLDGNFEKVLSDLEAVFDSGEISLSDLTGGETELHYIDFRFDNRVFIK